MSVVKYNAVVDCQSTDINGLPTSIEVHITDIKTHDIVDSFYREIEWGKLTPVSPVAKKLFKHLVGCQVVSSEMAMYELWTFLEKYIDMGETGSLRPIVFNDHSMKVLKNFLECKAYPHMYNVFNNLFIDVQQYAFFINSFLDLDGDGAFYCFDGGSPSVSFDVVKATEGFKEPTKGRNILKIYKSMLLACNEEINLNTRNKSDSGKSMCTSCSGKTVTNGKCFLCGAKA